MLCGEPGRRRGRQASRVMQGFPRFGLKPRIPRGKPAGRCLLLAAPPVVRNRAPPPRPRGAKRFPQENPGLRGAASLPAAGWSPAVPRRPVRSTAFG